MALRLLQGSNGRGLTWENRSAYARTTSSDFGGLVGCDKKEVTLTPLLLNMTVVDQDFDEKQNVRPNRGGRGDTKSRVPDKSIWQPRNAEGCRTMIRISSMREVRLQEAHA
jgi:hypothetical protein